jgi:hypothetical protein
MHKGHRAAISARLRPHVVARDPARAPHQTVLQTRRSRRAAQRGPLYRASVVRRGVAPVDQDAGQPSTDCPIGDRSVHVTALGLIPG